MTSDPIPFFLAEACLVTGDPRDFIASLDLIAAAQAWAADRGRPPLGRPAVSLRIAAAARSIQIAGRSFSRRKTAEVMGYSGIRLTEPTVQRLAAFRAA